MKDSDYREPGVTEMKTMVSANGGDSPFEALMPT